MMAQTDRIVLKNIRINGVHCIEDVDYKKCISRDGDDEIIFNFPLPIGTKIMYDIIHVDGPLRSTASFDFPVIGFALLMNGPSPEDKLWICAPYQMKPIFAKGAQ
jgi:hypothetical protein